MHINLMMRIRTTHVGKRILGCILSFYANEARGGDARQSVFTWKQGDGKIIYAVRWRIGEIIKFQAWYWAGGRVAMLISLGKIFIVPRTDNYLGDIENRQQQIERC